MKNNSVNGNQELGSEPVVSPTRHFFTPPVGNPDSWFCDICGWQVAMCGYLQRRKSAQPANAGTGDNKVTEE